MILKIFNQYIPSRKMVLFFFESAFIAGTVILGAYLRFLSYPQGFKTYEGLFYKAGLIVCIVQLCLYYFDLYDLKYFRSKLELSIRLLQSLGVSSILLALLYYFLPELIIGRGIFLLSLVFMALAVLCWRQLYNSLLRAKGLDQRIVILGTGALARNIAQEVIERSDTGFEIMGFISETPGRIGERVVNPSVIADTSQIPGIVEREKITRIIVALEERRGQFPQAELLECKVRGTLVQEGIDFYEHLTGKLMVQEIRPSFLIFSEGFHKSKLLLWVKRTIEVILSLVLFISLTPLMLLISMLIKIDSKGSILYSQERVGENGKIFRLLKFRSMVRDAETNGPVWAGKDDARVTKLGRWIRKFRLDELPQLINVLRGDMSFVGPRPERPFFVEQLQREIPYYGQRFAVKPGITGWAQIKYRYGASKEDALEKLKYDLYYIKNLSSLLDLLIIFETIKVVLFGKGAR